MATYLRQYFNFLIRPLVLVGAVWASPANAVLVNLEDKSGPSTFWASCGSNTACAQTVTEHTAGGDVTLTGGIILTNTTALPANESTVYGSMSNDYLGVNANLANPITITFSQPVAGFLIDVINGLTTPGAYRVADNLGASATFTLASNAGLGATTIGFLSTGTVVTVTSLSSETTYDMLVDNIRFDIPITCDTQGCREVAGTPAGIAVAVPEPASGGLLAVGLAVVLRRKRQA